jgi:ribose/xylose/arabinose/galactoside ABC-type transport system permease subunit
MMETDSRSNGWYRTACHWARQLLPFLGLALLVSFLAWRVPDTFLKPGNLERLFCRSSVMVLIAVGMTFVMLTGHIDLSVGSMMALAGMAGTGALSHNAPAWLAVVVGMAVGLGCGVVNALLTTQLRIPAFIATLGTMGVYRGLALLSTDALPIYLPEPFNRLAAGSVLRVPIPVWMYAFVCLMAAYALRRTVFGRHVYALGSNREAAFHAGIRINMVTVTVFAILGALTGLAGMVEAARVVSGQPTAGEGYELHVIAAVVIGGGSLSGGEGSILGTLAGAFLMAVLANGCVLLDISPHLQRVVIGVLIVLAVALDQLLRRRLS